MKKITIYLLLTLLPFSATANQLTSIFVTGERASVRMQTEDGTKTYPVLLAALPEEQLAIAQAAIKHHVDTTLAAGYEPVVIHLTWHPDAVVTETVMEDQNGIDVEVPSAWRDEVRTVTKGRKGGATKSFTSSSEALPATIRDGLVGIRVWFETLTEADFALLSQHPNS